MINDDCQKDLTGDFEITEPNAGAMIESLRAFGYDLQTSISDIIDNSISAGAKNVWMDFYWYGEKSFISIKDDGTGMTKTELINAMRPGSKNPLEERSPEDLGRFGLGLKTASFSQCRKLTVATKDTKKNINVRCWDLDYVISTDEWRLLKVNSNNEFFKTHLDNIDHGTIVLWEKIDRIVAGTDLDNEKDHMLFTERIENVKNHIEMVFHRFIERESKLKIWINGQSLKAWDPFLKNEKATQFLNEESFVSRKILIKPYVLPHHSKIDDKTHTNAAGPEGWNASQGFYVYRNERLIVCGDWLGLGFKKEEHYKLARIEVNIPNSMDGEWKIDVKKSIARPPAYLRDELKRIAKITRKNAAAIYRHRGKAIAKANSSDFVYMWEQKKRHSKTFYSINRNHPLIQDLLTNSGDNTSKISALLRMIEETIPIPLIALNNSESPDNHTKPFERIPSNELIDVIAEVYKSLLVSGIDSNGVKNRLLSMEPFKEYPEFVVTFIESIEEGK